MPAVPNWDRYFLDICRVVRTRSKDPSTQIGCVIVGPAREIRSTGYNSLPRGVRDDVPERFVRPTKYLWIEHAERNAIYNAARCGTPMEGCTLYCELLPCMDCARAIVQAGIAEIVLDQARVEEYSSGHYDPHFGEARKLLEEGGVKLRLVDDQSRKRSRKSAGTTGQTPSGRRAKR